MIKTRNKVILLTFFIALSMLILIIGSIFTFKIATRVKTSVDSYLSLARAPEQARILREQMKQVGESNVELLERAYPIQGDIVPFISALEGLAAETKISQQFKTGETGTEGSLTYFRFSLDLNCNAAQLADYLGKFQKVPFFAVIETFTISDAVDITGESSVHLTGKLFTRQP